MSQRQDTQLERMLNNPIFNHEELLLLAHARALLSDPQKWVKGRLYAIDPETKEKSAYCIQGAIQHFAEDMGFGKEVVERTMTLMRTAVSDLGFGAFQAFNDYEKTTHDNLMIVFTKAIKVGLTYYTMQQQKSAAE